MNILVFGDSITQGFHDGEKSGWCNRLAAHEIQRLVESNFRDGHSIFNLGISGERSCDLVGRFEAEINARRDNDEQLVLIAIGVNDSAYNRSVGANWCDVGAFEENVSQMVAYAKKQGRVMLIGIAPVDEKALDPIPWFSEYSYLDSEVKKYNTVLEKIAGDSGIPLVSMDGVFGDDVASKTVDGIHPNAEGHRLMFERIKKALEEGDVL